MTGPSIGQGVVAERKGNFRFYRMEGGSWKELDYISR